MSGSGDRFLGADRSSLTRINRSNYESANLTILSNTHSARYYLLFVVDARGSYAESNERNNVQAVSFSVRSRIVVD
ncbi:MAG: hypothetical protein KAG28_05785 [Cocleimonas sp.]|nr:hypothetical protein [Cocleimonas sp.]